MAPRPPQVHGVVGGGLIIKGKATAVGPAYRFGVQQSDELRRADGLKRSSTNGATAAHAPINLPSRGHLAQMRDLFRFRVESRSRGRV